MLYKTSKAPPVHHPSPSVQAPSRLYISILFPLGTIFLMKVDPVPEPTHWQYSRFLQESALCNAQVNPCEIVTHNGLSKHAALHCSRFIWWKTFKPPPVHQPSPSLQAPSRSYISMISSMIPLGTRFLIKVVPVPDATHWQYSPFLQESELCCTHFCPYEIVTHNGLFKHVALHSSRSMLYKTSKAPPVHHPSPSVQAPSRLYISILFPLGTIFLMKVDPVPEPTHWQYSRFLQESALCNAQVNPCEIVTHNGLSKHAALHCSRFIWWKTFKPPPVHQPSPSVQAPSRSYISMTSSMIPPADNSRLDDCVSSPLVLTYFFPESAMRESNLLETGLLSLRSVYILLYKDLAGSSTHWLFERMHVDSKPDPWQFSIWVPHSAQSDTFAESRPCDWAQWREQYAELLILINSITKSTICILLFKTKI